MTVINPHGQAGSADSINGTGQIAGNIFVNGNQIGVVWTPLPGGGYTMTTLGRQANDINSSGQVVRFATNVHATIWDGVHRGCVPPSAQPTG